MIKEEPPTPESAKYDKSNSKASNHMKVDQEDGESSSSTSKHATSKQGTEEGSTKPKGGGALACNLVLT